MKIDIHAHEYPKTYVKEINRLVAKGKFPKPVKALIPWRIDDHLALMEREGIDMQILSLATARYGDDRASERELTQMINESFAEAAEKYPGKFAAFASIPLFFVEDAIEELERAVGKLGMCGVIIGTNVAGKSLTLSEFQPFFEAVNRFKLPVLIHPMDPGWPNSYREYRLDLWLGWPFETTLAVSRMMIAGMFDDYRDFPLIVSHLGGNLHYLCERIEMGSLEGRAKEKPREYLRRFYYDTAGPVPPEAVGCALKMFGSGNVVFGSDYPFGPDSGETYIRKAIACIEMQDCPSDEKEAIFAMNARRILNL